MYITNLANVVRASGLAVVEHSGWMQRGHGGLIAVDGVVCHHTGAEGGGWLDVLINGRSDLPGPLCNLALGLDGTVHVVAAGLAYHAGVVTDPRWSNGHSIGIEAENYGTYLPWTIAQYSAYARLVASVLKGFSLAVSVVKGHKEVASPLGRKDDPNFNMNDFRGEVSAQLFAPTTSEDDMPFSAQNFKLPGFAFDATGAIIDRDNVLTLGTPLGGLTGLTRGWVSISADLSNAAVTGTGIAQSTVRVATATRTNDKSAWNVITVTLDSSTARQAVQLPTGCDKVSVGRVSTVNGADETVPIGITLELQ